MTLLKKVEAKKIVRRKVVKLPAQSGRQEPKDRFDQILRNLDKLRMERDRCDVEIAALNEELLTIMRTKSVSRTMDDGTVLKATRTEGRTSTTLNDQKLRTRLGAVLWNKVTSRALDKGKLDSAIASGVVDAVVVAACIEETKGKPYIVFSKR